MKKIKTVIRAVLSAVILSCLVFGAAGCVTNSGKKRAVKEIEAYAALLLERNEFDEGNERKIESIKAEGREAVKPCKDKAELEAAVNDAKYRMDAVDPIENIDADISGTFYTLEEAYKQGFLTKGDLKRIAFYYNYSENATQYPRSINAQIEWAIKEAAAEAYNNKYTHSSGEKETAEDFEIYKFYGRYSNCFGVLLHNRKISHGAVDVNVLKKIGGVQFHVVDPCEIAVWKIN